MATSISFEILAKDHASSTFIKVAAAAEAAKASFGDAGTAALGLTKAFGATGLVPVVAGASAALIELSTSAAAGGLALGVFGVSAVGTVASMAKAQVQIKATDLALSKLTPGTAAYRTEVQKLKGQQVAFNTSFGPAAKGYNDMTNAFTKFQTATSHVTLGVLHQGLELIAKVLPRLVPVSNAAGKAVGHLLTGLSSWTKSPSFTKVLHWLEKSGPKAIKAFGSSVGNIIVGLGGILKNFVGPGNKAAHTMELLTARFAKWGNSKGVSNSVDGFLKYISSNGGKITSVLASLAQTVPKLVIALGGLGATNLSAIGMFLNLVAGLPQGVFNVLAKGLFAMYVSTKLWTIATGTANAVAAVALIRLKMLTVGTIENTIATKVAAAASKAWAAAQWLLNAAMDANPIGLVIVAVAALAVGLVVAYKKSATFRAIVQGAFHGVQQVASKVLGWLKSAVSSTIGFVKAHWMLLLGILGGPVALAAVLVIRNFGKIKAAVAAAVGAVIGFVKSHWQLLAALIGGPIALAAILVIKNFDKIKSAVSSAIGAVLKIARSIPGKVKAAIGNLGHVLFSAGIALMNGLIAGIDSRISAVMGKLADLGSKIKGTFSKAMGIFSPSKVFRGYGQNLMDGLMQGIADRKLSLQAAITKVAALIQQVAGKISNLMSTRQGFMQTFTGDSVFATQTTDTLKKNDDIGTIIDAQKEQARKAHKFLRDVRKATKLGLSKSLVKQLESEGEAGAAALHRIAEGNRHDVHRLNRLNRETNASLQAAGMRAGNYVRGGSINSDIRIAQKQEHVLEQLEHHLRDLAHSEKKGQTIVVEIDGEAVIRSIVRRNKRKGVKTAGV